MAPMTAPMSAIRSSQARAPASRRKVSMRVLLSQGACRPRGMMAKPMRVHPYLALLRHNRSFSRLYGAQLISFAGDWFATVAILGLTLELTGSPTVAALLLVVQTGAFAIASPI